MGVGAAPAGLLPLLREIGDLKRVTSAGRPGSIAERAFGQAWAALAAGDAPEAVAFRIAAGCVAATRLGDLDADMLAALGLSGDEALDVRRSAKVPIADVLPRAVAGGRLEGLRGPAGPEAEPPPFVRRLAAQPRAGVTCPGRARIVLQPAENHAEHCLVVAVYGLLLAPAYGADPAAVFTAGLAHHLHNAAMPDAGFTGETLLGDHLGPVMERATGAALDELPPGLRREVVRAREILPDAETPEGRAFHAADVIDRVLEIDQHLQAARLTMGTVLGEMELVHAGPVRPFHDRVLVEMGLP